MRELLIALLYSVSCLALGAHFGFVSGLITLLIAVIVLIVALATLEALGVVSFRLETEVEIESD